MDWFGQLPVLLFDGQHWRWRKSHLLAQFHYPIEFISLGEDNGPGASSAKAVISKLGKAGAVDFWSGAAVFGVFANLKLAPSTMTTQDERSARHLVDAKRSLNEKERVATRSHLAGLGAGDRDALATSGAFPLNLRDLKLVNSHLASIGYAVLKPSERLPLAASATPERTGG